MCRHLLRSEGVYDALGDVRSVLAFPQFVDYEDVFEAILCAQVLTREQAELADRLTHRQGSGEVPPAKSTACMCMWCCSQHRSCHSLLVCIDAERPVVGTAATCFLLDGCLAFAGAS